jgi:hypothetical protein
LGSQAQQPPEKYLQAVHKKVKVPQKTDLPDDDNLQIWKETNRHQPVYTILEPVDSFPLGIKVE